MNKSVKVVFVIFFIFAVFCIPAQSALSQRYLKSANEKLAQGDYQRAFEYINYVMDTYEPDSIPQEYICKNRGKSAKISCGEF